MADAHGTVWAVGERECSIQRRHQKIIEEAPSPLVERTPGMRAKLFEAARLAAEAIGYTGAGTVEFMADEARRLLLPRDEHPPAGRAPGHRGDHRPRPGRAAAATSPTAAAWRRNRLPHAGIRSRRGSTPRTRPRAGSRRPGPIHRFDVPTARAEFGTLGHAGVRVDSGVVDGSVVSVFYDPMLAKVISYAPTRRQAAAILADALARTRLHGIRPTATCWSTCCATRRSSTAPPTPRSSTPTDWPSSPRRWPTRPRRRSPRWPPHWPTPPRTAAAQRRSAVLPSGWRNLPSGYQTKRYARRGGRRARGRIPVRPRPPRPAATPTTSTLVSATPDRVVLAAAASSARSTSPATATEVFVDGPLGPVRLTAQPRFPDPDSAVAQGSLLAPMPGSVTGSARRSATRSRPASR